MLYIGCSRYDYAAVARNFFVLGEYRKFARSALLLRDTKHMARIMQLEQQKKRTSWARRNLAMFLSFVVPFLTGTVLVCRLFFGKFEQGMLRTLDIRGPGNNAPALSDSLSLYGDTLIIGIIGGLIAGVIGFLCCWAIQQFLKINHQSS